MRTESPGSQAILSPNIQSRVSQLSTKVVDNHGRQHKNIGNATDPQDAVPLSQMQTAIAAVPTNSGTNKTVYVNNGTTSGFQILTIASNDVAIDLKNGVGLKLILNQATQVTIQNPIWTGVGTISPGTIITLAVLQDATGGRPTPVFPSGAGGFAPDVIMNPSGGGNFNIDKSLHTYTAYILQFWDDGIWHCLSKITGLLYQ